MMDFTAVPPEVSSTLMYSGPGSAPMLSAAASWQSIAAEMHSAAAAYETVVSGLTSTHWFGPSSVAMFSAAKPYIEWLSKTATQAEQTGMQAFAAATAFDTAFAMTVPPALVLANRSTVMTLVATNVFGQNTPAIAIAETEYAHMWAQDVAAMNGYAASSNTASEFTPLSSPPSATNSEGTAAQSTAQAKIAQSAANGAANASNPADVWSDLGINIDPSGLLTGTDNSALGQFLMGNFSSTGLFNGAMAGGPFNPQFIIGSIASFHLPQMVEGAGASDAGGTLDAIIGAPVLAGSHVATTTVPGLVSAPSATGEIGAARLVGTMSVPPNWMSAANIAQANAAMPATGLTHTGAAPIGGPGGVVGPMGTKGRGRRAIPKYGFRPVVMGRPPAAG